MSKLSITPIAFESFGVRSMCTYVETPDVKILLDAGVALGPRFGLLPHPLEYAALRDARLRIKKAAERAEVITVSHYHFDHHTPDYLETVWLWSSKEEAREVYADKLVLAKDIRSFINYSQRKRGWLFQKFCKKVCKGYAIADGRSFTFGSTTIRFSEPVPHGEEDSLLGWVLLIAIAVQGDKFVYAPDVQGPISASTLKLIVQEKPTRLILGGPPLYLSDYRVSSESIRKGMKNLELIVKRVPEVILDHHILRSENWRAEADPILKAAEARGHRVLTASEFLGLPSKLLECIRKRLYEEYPPSKEFLKWGELPDSKRRREFPPI